MGSGVWGIVGQCYRVSRASAAAAVLSAYCRTACTCGRMPSCLWIWPMVSRRLWACGFPAEPNKPSGPWPACWRGRQFQTPPAEGCCRRPIGAGTSSGCGGEGDPGSTGDGGVSSGTAAQLFQRTPHMFPAQYPEILVDKPRTSIRIAVSQRD